MKSTSLDILSRPMSIKKYILLIVTILSGSVTYAASDTWTEDGLFDSAEVRDTLSMRHKPIYFDRSDLKSLDKDQEDTSEVPEGGWILLKYLKNRRALTGGTCAINKMISTAKVAGWNTNLDNLLNDNLDDYIEINGAVSASVAVDPVISVRDRSCYYARGTTAGFCMVAGSGNDVLSLDIVKAMAIGFYREGNLVGVVSTTDGQDAGLLNLSVVQIPGTGDACINVTAEAPGVFDEISLDFPGGVNLGVGQNLRIKYAFVGKATEFTVTEFDYHNNQYGILPAEGNQNGHTPVYHDYHPENEDVVLKDIVGYNPVLLGLPFPMVASEIAKFTNSDLTDAIVATPLVSVAYRGGVKFRLSHSEESNNGKEVFGPGTEVGFVYQTGKLLELGVGTWMEIVLYDADGNKVHTESLEAGVLGLGLAGGGRQTASIVSHVPFSGAELRFMSGLDVDLGGISMYYAYVREQPEVRHKCPINPSVSTIVCPEQDTYQLRSNPAISVSWSIKHKPEGSPVEVSESGYVSGMDQAAERAADDYTYVFVATAADGCTAEVTLIHAEDDDAEIYNSKCGVPLTNNLEDEDAPKYAVMTEENYPGVTGGLLHFDDLRNPENVLTTDLKDYATYIGGLEVATNVPVIGIATTDGTHIVDYSKPEATKKRLGFMIASTVEGLNLGALQFWQIECLRNNGENGWESICRKVIDESNLVSTDIGGSNASQKVRYSIEVPSEDDKGEPVKVDAIILWNSGVIDVGGGAIHIYYPFVEEAEAGCNDPMGCEPVYVSWEDSGATLDYDLMQGGSAIVVANAVNDLDNFIDMDMDSYMSIANSVSLGDGVVVAARLGRTVDYHHQLGLVMDNKTFLAGVNAGSWMTIETYYNGQPTGDKFTDWNVVDANVVGYGDKNVIIVQPKYLYDEVKLTIAKTIGALDVMKFYGMFLRGDIDNDGVPDCQDPESCSDNVKLMAADKVCVGDDIEFIAAGKDMTTGYWIRFSEPGIPAEKQLMYLTPERDGFLHAAYTTEHAGAYQIIFYENRRVETGETDDEGHLLLDSEGNPLAKDMPGKTLAAEPYYVYPEETVWLANATNSDWTKWDNWSNGTPYCCTRVTIPSGAAHYPDLTGKVEKGDEYCCEGIFFESEGRIGRIHKLNYEKAWVELAAIPNRYHLLSAPLRRMYTGDMFIPAAMAGRHDGPRFQPITADNAPENRFNPTIYQRMWNSSVLEQGWSNSGAQILPGLVEVKELSTTRWSKNFNHVVTEYKTGQGFSLWIDNGNLPADDMMLFRFPKEHTAYRYFNDFDPSEDTGIKEENISRVGEVNGKDVDVSGRFIYEGEVQHAMKFAPTYSEDFKGRRYDRTVYQSALPMNITLDAQESTTHFLFGNPFLSRINIERLLSENEDVIEGIMRYDGNGMTSVLATSEGLVGEGGEIQPMEAVFVIAKGEATTIQLTLTEDMIRDDAPETPEIEEAPQVRIVVEAGNRQSAMSVTTAQSDVANVALFENEVIPELAVFAIDEGQAFDIIGGKPSVPLSVVNRTGKPARMTFHISGGVERDDYEVYDAAEDTAYSLDDEIVIPATIQSAGGRYTLRKRIVTPVEEEFSNDIYVECHDGELKVVSRNSKIREIEVVGLDGKVLCASSPCMPEAILQAPEGIFIVMVKTEKGERNSFKLYR